MPLFPGAIPIKYLHTIDSYRDIPNYQSFCYGLDSACSAYVPLFPGAISKQVPTYVHNRQLGSLTVSLMCHYFLVKFAKRDLRRALSYRLIHAYIHAMRQLAIAI